MALIKSISEMRAVLPRISSLSDSASLPNLDRAAWKYIIPLIGQPLYDDLNTKYNTPDAVLSDSNKALIKHLQLPLAAYGLYDELPFIHATITDNGIRTASTSQMQSAHRWEYNEIRNALLDSALAGTEIALDYLFKNKLLFPLWTADPVYTFQSSLLIKTSAEFDLLYKIYQPQRTYFQLRPIMADVEENYLVALLGRDMLAFIKSSDTVETTKDHAVVNVKQLLKKAAALLTIKAACEHFQVDFGSSGFTILASGGDSEGDSSGRSPGDYSSIAAKRDAANRDGQNYLSKVAFYLAGMGAGVFPDDGLGADFVTAYEGSPLYINPTLEAVTLTNGNERRRIFII